MNSCVDKLTKSFEDSIVRLTSEHRHNMSEINGRIVKLEAHLIHLEVKGTTDFPPLVAATTWSGVASRGVQSISAPASAGKNCKGL